MTKNKDEAESVEQEETDEETTQADDPGVDDLHTDVPLGMPVAKKKKPTSLGRLAQAARQHFATGRMMDAGTFDRMFRQSIGATGGSGTKLAAEAEAPDQHMVIGDMQVEGLPDNDPGSRQFSAHFRGDDGQEFRLLIPLALSEGEDPTKDRWVEYLPRPGVWESPRYGTMQITAERNARFVQQFNEGVYQNQIPVDPEHETKLGGALGWIKMGGGMRISPTGSVEAYVEWTDRGRKMLAERRFKFFSPEWYDSWDDPATGKTFSDVAIGGALTTRPFFKPSSLRPIIASEDGIFAVTVVRPQEGTTVADNETENTTDPAKALSEALAKVAKLEADLAARTTVTASEDVARQAAEVASENKTLREMTEQLVGQVKTAGERIAAMEEATERRQFAEIAREWSGDRDTHVNLLMSLSETPTGEDGKGPSLRDMYITTQRAASEQLRKLDQFRPAGVSAAQANGRGGSVVAEVRSAAEKTVTETNGATNMAKAMAEAWTDERYAEYLRESGN